MRFVCCLMSKGNEICCCRFVWWIVKVRSVQRHICSCTLRGNPAQSRHEQQRALTVKRLIIGISGASGAIYGVRLLQVLRDVADVETHLVMSAAARQTLALETDLSVREVQALANVNHDARDIAASISSGSFQTAGMVILPCSIKTLSGIVHSYTDGLLTRAADVVLKERRPLVLCVRETPLHLGHLRLMTQAAEIGAVIMPPVSAFYHRPQTLDDVINQTVNRVLDQFDISLPQDLFTRWQGA